MGIPRPRAHRNLTVRHTRSVTRWEASAAELARLPPRASTACSARASATPVKSTCGGISLSWSQQPTRQGLSPKPLGLLPPPHLLPQSTRPLLSYFGGCGLMFRFGPTEAAAWHSLGLLSFVFLSLAWSWNDHILGLRRIFVRLSEDPSLSQPRGPSRLLTSSFSVGSSSSRNTVFWWTSPLWSRF